MKFECGDLERALANTDLMPEAREHLKTCADCRSEYRLWADLPKAARELHQTWDSPNLWSNIRAAVEAERRPHLAWWRDWTIHDWAMDDWKLWAVAAVVLIAIGLPLQTWKGQPPRAATGVMPVEITSANGDFLTEQALEEVERSEAAYRHSIEKLSRLTKPRLENAKAPAMVNAKEKLRLLDAAIDDTRSNVASNRFNLNLQRTLAGLYLEKQQTLQSLLRPDAKN